MSIQTVKNYSMNLKHYDTVLLPGMSRMGRLPAMTCEMTDVSFLKLHNGIEISLSLILSLGFKGIYQRKPLYIS